MGLAMFLVAAVVPSAAVAATPKCFGKPATIVSSNGTITGTKKNDVIVSKSRSGSAIDGKGGSDLICGGRGSDFIFGSGGNDKLKGNGQGDYLSGGSGNDTLVGDPRDGGALDVANYVPASTGISIDFTTGVATGEGTDKLVKLDGVFASEYADIVNGGEGTDFIWGQGGDDVIDGRGGLDLITPGPGDDMVNGGAGAPESDLDIFYVNDATGPAQVDLDAGTATGAGVGTDSIDEFEIIVGSDYDDTLEGDGESNFLFGGLGNDLLDGAGGTDYASYWFAAAAVDANLQTRVATGEGTDSLLNFEGLLGTMGFDDTLTGDNQGNYIDGDGGNDVLSGGGGDDWFVGGLGNDTVDGGGGNFDFWDYYGTESINANLSTGTVTTPSGQSISLAGVEAVAGADKPDVLVGDDAVNYLYGWGGNDQLTGGAGNDEIDGGGGTDSGDAGAGTDTCARADSVASCEAEVAEITLHPLQAESAAVQNLRRNI